MWRSRRARTRQAATDLGGCGSRADRLYKSSESRVTPSGRAAPGARGPPTMLAGARPEGHYPVSMPTTAWGSPRRRRPASLVHLRAPAQPPVLDRRAAAGAPADDHRRSRRGADRQDAGERPRTRRTIDALDGGRDGALARGGGAQAGGRDRSLLVVDAALDRNGAEDRPRRAAPCRRPPTANPS